MPTTHRAHADEAKADAVDGRDAVPGPGRVRKDQRACQNGRGGLNELPARRLCMARHDMAFPCG